jgi:hypothetical protein
MCVAFGFVVKGGCVAGRTFEGFSRHGLNKEEVVERPTVWALKLDSCLSRSFETSFEMG